MHFEVLLIQIWIVSERDALLRYHECCTQKSPLRWCVQCWIFIIISIVTRKRTNGGLQVVLTEWLRHISSHKAVFSAKSAITIISPVFRDSFKFSMQPAFSLAIRSSNNSFFRLVSNESRKSEMFWTWTVSWQPLLILDLIEQVILHVRFKFILKTYCSLTLKIHRQSIQHMVVDCTELLRGNGNGVWILSILILS